MTANEIREAVIEYWLKEYSHVLKRDGAELAYDLPYTLRQGAPGERFATFAEAQDHPAFSSMENSIDWLPWPVHIPYPEEAE